MTLRHIRIFLAVCDCGNNITRAAEKLFLAQPAVSLAVAELEKHYGVKLFDRIGRRLYLTQAGERMRQYALHIMSLFSDMERSLRDWDAVGIIRVGASITIGSQFLPSYAEVYRALHPDVEVRVLIGPSEQLEGRLMRNELDFALIEGAAHEPNLIVEDYMEDLLSAVCAPGNPFEQGALIEPEEFSRQRFLLREHGSGTREAFDSVMQAAGFAVSPAWEGMSTTALVNAAVHGLGVAVLPRRMLSGPLERGLIVSFSVKGLDFRRRFRVVYHKDKFLSPCVKAFIELCKGYEMDYPLPRYHGLY